jgi:hypothetical protein
VAGSIFDDCRLYALSKHGSTTVPHLVKKRKCFVVFGPRTAVFDKLKIKCTTVRRSSLYKGSPTLFLGNGDHNG